MKIILDQSSEMSTLPVTSRATSAIVGEYIRNVADFIRNLEEAVCTVKKCDSVRDWSEAALCNEEAKRIKREADRLRAEYILLERLRK